MSQILVERFDLREMKYIAEATKGSRYLGRFEGIAADFLHPTRNGRRYPLELWEKVANSPDFIEAMETKTLYGEADHPEERLETLITEAAICLRSFEIRKDEGVVWCSFDILDTPRGRILKSLLDYGSKIGVSSRGSGEEVVVNGETIIDPETYLFICFDAVIMPAVKAARQSVTESVDVKKAKNLTESVKSEIKKARTSAELHSIRSIIEAVNMPELDSLKESINIQLEKLGTGEDISTNLLADLENSTKRVEELELENKNLKKSNTARKTRITELRALVSKMESTEKTLRRLLNDAKKDASEFESSIVESASQCDEFETELTSLRNENKRLRFKMNSIKKENKNLEDKCKSLEASKSKLTESNIRMNTSDHNKTTKIVNLGENNKKLTEQLASIKDELSKKRISESKLTEQVTNLSERLQKSNSMLKKATESYLTTMANNSGIPIDTIKRFLPKNYNIEDIDKVTESLRRRNDNIRKMPIAFESVDTAISIDVNEPSPELAQTMRMLESFKK